MEISGADAACTPTFTVEISGEARENAESPFPATCHAASTTRITAAPHASAVEVMPLKETVATSPLQETESAAFADDQPMAVRSRVRLELPHWRSVQPFLSMTVTVRLVESIPLLTMEALESDAALTWGKTSTFTVAV